MASNVLICYSFAKINPDLRKKFDRKLFGTLEKSHNGKYTTKIKGLLTEIPHKRPVRSVIIMEIKHLPSVVKILKDFSANMEVYRIEPINMDT